MTEKAKINLTKKKYSMIRFIYGIACAMFMIQKFKDKVNGFVNSKISLKHTILLGTLYSRSSSIKGGSGKCAGGS